MTTLKNLLKIHESATIKPSFKIVHVILALFIIEENYDGIGRYKLQKSLNLREGQVKSLLERMKKLDLIQISSRTKGHTLSQSGIKMLQDLRKFISNPIKPNFDYKNITIGKCAYYCIIYNSAEKLRLSKQDGELLKQRDAAIKIGGTGATSLIYSNDKFHYPFGPEKIIPKLNPEEIEIEVKENDVLVIGTGESFDIARIATLSAALTFIDFLDQSKG